jgi:hypothetical protein
MKIVIAMASKLPPTFKENKPCWFVIFYFVFSTSHYYSPQSASAKVSYGVREGVTNFVFGAVGAR